MKKILNRDDVVRAYLAVLQLGDDLETYKPEENQLVERIVDEAMADAHELDECEATGVLYRLDRLANDLLEMAELLSQELYG